MYKRKSKKKYKKNEKMKKKIPVGPFRPTRPVHRKQLFIQLNKGGPMISLQDFIVLNVTCKNKQLTKPHN